MAKVIEFTKDKTCSYGEDEDEKELKNYCEEKKEFLNYLYYVLCDYESCFEEANLVLGEIGSKNKVIDEFYAYVYTMIAQCFHKFGNIDKALSVGKKAISYANDPHNNYMVNWLLAICYFKINTAKSINHYKRCLMLLSDTQHQYYCIKFNIAYLENNIDGMIKAIEGFSSLKEIENGEFAVNEFYEFLSKKYCENGDIENSINVANKITNEETKNDLLALINKHQNQVVYY